MSSRRKRDDSLNRIEGIVSKQHCRGTPSVSVDSMVSRESEDGNCSGIEYLLTPSGVVEINSADSAEMKNHFRARYRMAHYKRPKVSAKSHAEGPARGTGRDSGY